MKKTNYQKGFGSAPSILCGLAPRADCAIRGIFALLIYYTGDRLTDSHGSHAFELWCALRFCGEWASYPVVLRVSFPFRHYKYSII